MDKKINSEDYKKVLKTSRFTRIASMLMFFLGGIGLYFAMEFNAQVGGGTMTFVGLTGAILVGLLWHQASIVSAISRNVLKFESIDDYVKHVEESKNKKDE